MGIHNSRGCSNVATFFFESEFISRSSYTVKWQASGHNSQLLAVATSEFTLETHSGPLLTNVDHFVGSLRDIFFPATVELASIAKLTEIPRDPETPKQDSTSDDGSAIGENFVLPAQGLFTSRAERSEGAFGKTPCDSRGFQIRKVVYTNKAKHKGKTRDL